VFQYCVRRLIAMLLTLIAISIITFGLFFAVPTDPARLTCGKNCTPQLLQANRVFLGYDKSVPEQYAEFAKGIFVGRDYPDDAALRRKAPQTVVHCSAPCLGYSQTEGQTVNHYLAAGLPITVSIAVGGFVVWFLFGVGFGVLAAIRPGKLLDKLVLGVALIGYSFPTFFVGLILVNLVAIKYRLLPQPAYVPITTDPVDWAKGMVVAWIALASSMAALYVRLTRAKMIETMGEDYIRTARAKGLRKRTVIFKHGLRAALTPIITIAGLDLGGALAGAAVTEQVTNLNGIGKQGIFAIQQFDLPVIVAVVLLAAAIVVVMNFITDLMYAVVDPRVTYA
jgi:peptide/nickel transport system permease protein